MNLKPTLFEARTSSVFLTLLFSSSLVLTGCGPSDEEMRLKGLYQQTKQESTQLQSQLSQVNNELESLKLSQDVLSQENTTQKKHLAEAEAKLKQQGSHLASVESTLANKNKALSDKQTILVSYRDELKNKKAELNQANTALKTSGDKLKHLEGRYMQLVKQNQSASEKLSLQKEKIAGLELIRTDLMAKTNKSQQDLNGVNGQLLGLQERMSLLQGQLKDAQNQLQESQKTGEIKLQEMTTRVEQKNSEIQQLNFQLRDKTQSYLELLEDFQIRGANLNVALAKMSKQTQEIKKFAATMAEKDKTIANLMAEVENKKKQNAEQEAVLKKLKQAMLEKPMKQQPATAGAVKENAKPAQ